MKKPFIVLLLVCAAIATFVPMSRSQPPGDAPDGPRRGREGERFRGGPPDGPRGQRGPNPLMQMLDTDRDGNLSPDEIEASSSALLKCDRNGDGVLSRNELGPPGGPGGEHQPDGPLPGGEGPDGPRGPGGRGPGAGPPGPPNPPELGDVLPPHVRHQLSLNETQAAEFNKLEEEVKTRLASILDKEQLVSVEAMLQRPPGPPPGGPNDGPRRPGGRRRGGPPRPPGPEREE